MVINSQSSQWACKVLLFPCYEETEVMWVAINHTDSSEQDSEPVGFQNKAHELNHDIPQLNKARLVFTFNPRLPTQDWSYFTKEKKQKSLNASPLIAFPGPDPFLPMSLCCSAMPARSGPLGFKILLTCYYLSSMASSNLLPNPVSSWTHLIDSLWMNPISSIYSFLLKATCLEARK